MDFDFPLIPLLPLPITLVPAATFAALEHNQNQIQQAYASSVSIGLSKSSASNSNSSISTISGTTAGSSPGLAASAASGLTDQERLGAIVDALGQASAKAQELPTSITQTLRLAKNPTQRVYILRTGLDSGEDQWLDQLEIGSPLMMESIRKSLCDLNGTSSSSTTTQDFISSRMSAAMSAQEEASKRSSRSRSEEKGVYVAGMLKIGEKKLFIVDKDGTMHEQEACCVLDFYVDKSCQRRGFGKLLFDYMLKVEDIEPNQIAYDRPSPKLFKFLSKHFQLERHVPQSNMYAIFEGYKLQDCGETIQVSDDESSASGRNSSSIPNSSSTDTTNNDNNTNTNNGRAPKAPAKSRALQSSVVFSSGIQTDSETNAQQATNRRISSAFSSSISLSSPTTNGPGNGRGLPPINTNSTNTSASSFSPNTPRTRSGGARISRLLTSSIVFADPAISD
ncbi:Alpha-tubulin N-acetyltransferase 1 [Mortierella sp. AD011]|nr:Alpha-tubulin N-acetyltransferase 1 [Mortierella sp. AD010]KAF9402799.1 Alpha-tubulin N-acetyltransferase 1 [Mortierella sp. AD011]